MSQAEALAQDTARWSASAVTVGAVHLGLIALAVMWVRAPEPRIEEPPVLIELPPLATSEIVGEAKPEEPVPAPPQPQVQQQVRPVEVPVVRAPIPEAAVRVPPPSPLPIQQRPAAPAAPTAPAPAATAPAPARALASGPASPGADAKAQKAEADYKSLVGSHIRRNRFSPPASRKAGLSGEVKVRFNVHRDGGIADVAVSGSSGHSLLDGEALEFIRRLSPVPAFPRDLAKAVIPLSITLKFELKSK